MFVAVGRLVRQQLSRPLPLALALATALAAPARAQTPKDPFEGVNRQIFAFNQVVDGAILEPVAIMYEAVFPSFVRRSVNNVLLNLSEPVNIVNAALQGDPERTADSFGRLFINTTVGIGGLFDVAGNLEEPYRRPYRREDFGQTLAVWGWEDSAYFVIPVFGPSTVRDTGGLAVDFATTPWGYFAPTEVTLPVAGVRAVDARSQVLDELEELERSSLDFYASLRSIYLQRRLNQIFNGNPPPADTDTLFDEEADGFFEEEPGQP